MSTSVRLDGTIPTEPEKKRTTRVIEIGAITVQIGENVSREDIETVILGLRLAAEELKGG